MERDEKSIDVIVNEVEEWYEEQKLSARPSRRKTERFLVHTKYNVEKTKELAQRYVDYHKNNAEWFKNRDPSNRTLKELFTAGVHVPMPGKAADGSTVVLCRPFRLSSRSYPMKDVYRAMLMSTDLLVDQDDDLLRCGVSLVFDLEVFSLGYLLQCTPSTFMGCVHMYQGSYPVQLRSMSFINCPRAVDGMLSVFRNFLPAKLKELTSNYTKDSEQFLSNSDFKQLPLEYGGNAGPLEEIISAWTDKISKQQDRFLSGEL